MKAFTEAAAARAPGTSITRRRKPADARGGAAERDDAQPPATKEPPRFLLSRVDALHIRFRGGLASDIRKVFADALLAAKEMGGRSVAVHVGAYEMLLSGRSRDGWWVLERNDFDIKMQEGSHLDGWGLTVKLRAMTLAMLGPTACAELAADVATSVLQVVEDERVAWIDLCADVTGFDVDSIDTRQWVGSGQAKVHKLTPSSVEGRREWFAGGERIAFYVGKGDLMLRVYDKTVALQNDVVGDKRAAEHLRWRAGGWNGIDRVTRVEFQVRGDALKEVDDGRLRDTTRFAGRLDALWKYLTCKWVRLCTVESASRRSRWATDPRWTNIQNVPFVEDAGEISQRSRLRGTPSVEYVASIALSHAAKSGKFDHVPLATAFEVARWHPPRARHFVLVTLGALLGAVGDEIAHRLLRQRGPVRSACFLVERLRSARARVASVLPRPGPLSLASVAWHGLVEEPCL